MAISIALMTVLLVSMASQAQAFKAVFDEKQRAEWTLNAAETAYLKANETITRIQQNQTLMTQLTSLGLDDDFEGNTSLLKEADIAIKDAQEAFDAGNYSDAIASALTAMKTVRDVFRNIGEILKEAGVRPTLEKPELQAQGLLVAINRSMERIECLNQTLSKINIQTETRSEINEALKAAKSLLNATEAQQLLAQGNVTEVAHRLAEANKLIAQAYKLLNLEVAKARIQDRLERYRLRIEEHLNRTLGELNETAIGKIMGQLRFRNEWEFRHHIGDLFEKARNITGNWKDALKEIGKNLQDFGRAYALKELPQSVQNENPSLNLEIQKTNQGKYVILKVTVTNTGNVAVTFPNAALGLIVERKNDGQWRPYYSPISAQVMVKLKPGEARNVQIRLPQEAQTGDYRVVVHAVSEFTYMPVAATAEFTLP